jgi:integrase/recombinase XerD
MGRRGQHTPRVIPGDPQDGQGFPVMVVEFCEHLAIRGYAATSLKNQRTALALLAEWLIERGVTRPCEVTKPMLDAYQRAVFYMRKRDGQPLSFRSQEGRLIPIRGFFRWLVRTNRILYNPASEIELPRKEQRLPGAVLSAEEAERVLALPDLSELLGLRDRTMMELLYATGIRRSELASLTVYELDIERQTVTVRQGKGRRDRMIPTGERAAAWCARYLVEARPKLAIEPDEGALFLAAEGVGLSPQTLTYLMGDYVRRIGKPGACHIFRHTMATVMLEGGADIRYIQQMLGHVNITSTQVYTQVSLRTLAAVHAATHPGACNQPRRRRASIASETLEEAVADRRLPHERAHKRSQSSPPRAPLGALLDGRRGDAPPGVILRPASDLAPGAPSNAGEDATEALHKLLDAEAETEQQDLTTRPRQLPTSP